MESSIDFLFQKMAGDELRRLVSLSMLMCAVQCQLHHLEEGDTSYYLLTTTAAILSFTS